jgi:dTDP-4-dehydrorhamnose 3,5-epimerase
MDIRELDIRDAYEIALQLHEDERGLFLEWYRIEALHGVRGHGLELRQANCSVSAAGVVREFTRRLYRPGRRSTSAACLDPCSMSLLTSGWDPRRSAGGRR